MSPRARRPLRAPRDAARELWRLMASQVTAGASRALQNGTRRGDHGAPITTGPDRTVLLFFEDVERDRFLRHDRHVRRAARRVYHALTHGQRATGFENAFRLLRRALERAGCRVVVNNFSLARRHPEHPVGICGYPHVLERWAPRNPAVLGPGLFDHPAQHPRLMDDPRFRTYLVPCDWMRELFAPVYGRCAVWFGGMDVDAWPDCRDQPKDIDVLVYEKVLWSREHAVPAVLDPVLRELHRRGLRTAVLRYGSYDRAEYLALLARARGMVFLCEHETQGLAYQEALACNVPVLAWDQGYWLDPVR
ncbi:MAG TPA: hypothetical protein VFS44_10600, partial [Gemmatimonadaceae bacterium]|nr:hypothetical protein [Gemmatimonadaceae bacterium]